MTEDLWLKTYKPLYEAVPNFINARSHFLKNLIKYFVKKNYIPQEIPEGLKRNPFAA